MKILKSRNDFFSANCLMAFSFVCAQQVHGTNIVYVTRDTVSPVPASDALITDDKRVILGIYTADCMPVMITSKKGCSAAAIHAGWRGLAGGIIEKTVAMFKKGFNVKGNDLSVYIGPHICGNCYEIGAEVRQAFNLLPSISKFSMVGNALERLKIAGISDVVVSKECTFCGDNYFSYRKGNKVERILTLAQAGKP
ncbi:MAG: peptidoglycan editing factor PgeF [Elusimicrobia bacterium]|nr:peptidoglycan editing factor PgeF [Elusimicrobiota bacterium]